MSLSLSDIVLNPEIDVDHYRNVLETKGRIQIPNFFTEDSAQHLMQAITQNDTWYLAYNEGNNYYESVAEDFKRLKPELKQRFTNNVYRRASNGFQYLFKQYFITQAVEREEDQGHPLHNIHEFLNGDSFIDLIRALTNEPAVSWCDTFVSSYEPGHFLTSHDDIHAKNKRVIAYTIGMTEGWQKNWGGHLAFFDDMGNIVEGLLPAFNTLNAFVIPQDHAVQFVAPFAAKERYSILGWANK